MSREDRAVFQAPKLGLLLSHFPLVPPLQNFRLMADLGTLPNLPEICFADTFGFAAKGCSIIALQAHINEQRRPAIFQAPKLGLLLSHFPLVLPLQNFRKWPI